jgi:hypothetical protein
MLMAPGMWPAAYSSGALVSINITGSLQQSVSLGVINAVIYFSLCLDQIGCGVGKHRFGLSQYRPVRTMQPHVFPLLIWHQWRKVFQGKNELKCQATKCRSVVQASIWRAGSKSNYCRRLDLMEDLRMRHVSKLEACHYAPG